MAYFRLLLTRTPTRHWRVPCPSRAACRPDRGPAYYSDGRSGPEQPARPRGVHLQPAARWHPDHVPQRRFTHDGPGRHGWSVQDRGVDVVRSRQAQQPCPHQYQHRRLGPRRGLHTAPATAVRCQVDDRRQGRRCGLPARPLRQRLVRRDARRLGTHGRGRPCPPRRHPHGCYRRRDAQRGERHASRPGQPGLDRAAHQRGRRCMVPQLGLQDGAGHQRLQLRRAAAADDPGQLARLLGRPARHVQRGPQVRQLHRGCPREVRAAHFRVHPALRRATRRFVGRGRPDDQPDRHGDVRRRGVTRWRPGARGHHRH